MTSRSRQDLADIDGRGSYGVDDCRGWRRRELLVELLLCGSGSGTCGGILHDLGWLTLGPRSTVTLPVPTGLAKCGVVLGSWFACSTVISDGGLHETIISLKGETKTKKTERRN